MCEPAYKSRDLDPALRFRLGGVIDAGGPPLTLKALNDSLDRNGADPALLEVALLLCEEEYCTFKARFQREKRTNPWPKRSKIRRRQ